MVQGAGPALDIQGMAIYDTQFGDNQPEINQ